MKKFVQTFHILRFLNIRLLLSIHSVMFKIDVNVSGLNKIYMSRVFPLVSKQKFWDSLLCVYVRWKNRENSWKIAHLNSCFRAENSSKIRMQWMRPELVVSFAAKVLILSKTPRMQFFPSIDKICFGWKCGNFVKICVKISTNW